MLRFSEKQSNENAKQSIEFVWQQSQPFQNPISVKQPVESKFQEVYFSLSFENTYFSKKLKSNNVGSSVRVD